ncbi:SAM-dependent methyltransferase [Microvirga lupini]|uniref:SAM-dependent methyltransferase n=1 Tax=Microvirga lupini TaxID=420324 RepID=A0A7W4VK74_9HYPH|nr:class I SAM-dependent methyltransferase [Microvirga lupini]MBB3018717.1 SAM-dependent methyltransferase [Microvirga lupini]
MAPARLMNWLKPKLPARPYKVVSFFTADNEYAAHSARLRETLERFAVPHNLVSIESAGPWEHTCAWKSRFLREQWEASEVPIVWIDADATVEAPPTLFNTIDSDFAVHKWDGWQFGSGTLYFGKTEAAKALLDQWLVRCEADPATWDQTHLQSAWCDISAQQELRTYWLPRSYLQIFDAKADEPAVIKHWQASRKPKAEGRTTGLPQLSHTLKGIEDRRNNRLWRTPEEAFWISQGTAHIKPELGFDFPEGFDVGEALHQAIAGQYPVLEVGCGVGRVASCFTPEQYVGVDVNPNALRQARASLPQHSFRIFDDGFEYPPAPTAMIYTVLLHVSDDALPPLLEQAVKGRQRFIIAEVMDTRWRREGNPPVFNRNPEDYILMMQDLGFRFVAVQKHAYERYDQEPWNVGRDSRITFLTFEAA